MSSDLRKVSDVKNHEYCIHPAMVVKHTWRSGRIVRRRRECLECGAEFTTSEMLPNRANAANLGLRVKTS